MQQASKEFFSSHNIDSMDEDQMFFHILECMGAISCIFSKSGASNPGENGESRLLRITKRRVFWKSVMEIANFQVQAMELESQSESEAKYHYNPPIYNILKCFPDPSKLKDGRSWLPLHFAASLPHNELSDFQVILSAQPNCIGQNLAKAIPLKPLHLSAMMKDPPLEAIQKLKTFYPPSGSSLLTSYGTPLHMAARYSNSIEMIQELINIYPPALKMSNTDGFFPLHCVKSNSSPAAATILQLLLEAAPETARMVTKGSLPLHYYLHSNAQELVPILLEANRDAVNIRDRYYLLPIHIAAKKSSLEIFKLIYEANVSHLTSLASAGSVAHMAASGNKLETLQYIHFLSPELLLSVDECGRTPLQVVVFHNYAASKLVKSLFALQPDAVRKGVQPDNETKQNIFHFLFIGANCPRLCDPLSDSSEILRFLVKVFPEGVSAMDGYGNTSYNLLETVVSSVREQYSYAFRLLLLAAPADFKAAERRRLNYLARKKALFAFFAPASKRNIFNRIAAAAGGEVLIKLITCFL